jgi:hypothetical protein
VPDDAPVAVTAYGEVRGTQSLVAVMQRVWKHPQWTALEILWRWIYGALALALLWHFGSAIWFAVSGSSSIAQQLSSITVTDPFVAAGKLGEVMAVLLPPVWEISLWLVPLLIALWIVVSVIGRMAVLARIEPALRVRPSTQIVLAVLRAVALCAMFGLWGWLLLGAGRYAVTGPLARNQEPNLVGYFAIVIVGTLAVFVAWLALSWLLSIAPLLAALRGTGVAASLRGALRLGPLRGKLVEINLVMGIVKIALIVLAMVFSACPLPFESVETQTFLVWWCAGVTLLYLVASDYFHIVRLEAYLALWHVYDREREQR